jgi:hypothetical protein
MGAEGISEESLLELERQFMIGTDGRGLISFGIVQTDLPFFQD